MMQRYPDCGGAYAFTKETFGYDHGFLCAWFLWLAYIAIIWANATAFILIFRKILGDVFAFGFHYTLFGYDIYLGEILITAILILVFGVLSLWRNAVSDGLNTVLAIILLGGIVVCFLLALRSRQWSLASIQPGFSGLRSPAAGVMAIVALAPWAFLGFESVSHSAEEFRFHRKKSFGVMAAGVIAAGAAYALTTLMAALDHPARYRGWEAYINGLDSESGLASMPVFYVIRQAAGQWGVILLAVTILAGIFTGLLGLYRCTSRLTWAVARDGVLPPWFTKLNRFHNPENVITVLMVLSLFVPFVGRTAIGWIVDVTTVGAAVAYGYTSAAAFVSARREGRRAQQLTGALGLGMAVFFLLYLLIPHIWTVSALAKESYLILSIWSILGLICFRQIFTRDRKERFGRNTAVWIVLLFLIFFTSLMWMRQATHGVMDEVVTSTGKYFTEQMGDYNRYRHQAQQVHLQEQMDIVQHALTVNSFVQMGLIVLSLATMFSIYGYIRRREKLTERDKLQAELAGKAKTDFLFNMSHDIRTPMNAIIGYTNLARREGTTPEEAQAYLTKISDSSQHLLALINDVLEMSRIESGKMELDLAPNDLVSALDEIRDMFLSQMTEKELTFTVDGSQVRNRRAVFDRHGLNRILLNLISNAYKFTPRGGAISVTLTESADSPEGFGAYQLRVKDSGIGMSPEFAEKVFEAFEREKTSTVSGIQGTGLGMAITRNLVDLMGGSIRVETAQGRGTEFILDLLFALAEPEEETEEAAEPDGRETDFTGIRLLLVEDNEINREVATLILEDLGFVLECAENGREAVEMVSSSEPGHYQAVLMDVQMPVMNGYEATRAIRSMPDPELAEIPIIAMTANAFQEDIQAAHSAGMDGHIAKPLDIAAMTGTLARILHEKEHRRR